MKISMSFDDLIIYALYIGIGLGIIKLLTMIIKQFKLESKKSELKTIQMRVPARNGHQDFQNEPVCPSPQIEKKILKRVPNQSGPAASSPIVMKDLPETNDAPPPTPQPEEEKLDLADLEKLLKTENPKKVEKTKTFSAHIPAAILQKVMARDKGKCACCGTLNNVGWRYITPLEEGGEATVENVQLICEDCDSKNDAT